MGSTKGVSAGAATLSPSTAGEDRDRRRDGPVAVEQRGADEPEHQKDRAPRAGLRLARPEQSQHGDDAALATVVGPHDQDGIFDRHHQDQGPQDHRGGADDGGGVGQGGIRHGGLDGFLQGVEGARADVAVDDAECPEGGGGLERGRGMLGGVVAHASLDSARRRLSRPLCPGSACHARRFSVPPVPQVLSACRMTGSGDVWALDQPDAVTSRMPSSAESRRRSSARSSRSGTARRGRTLGPRFGITRVVDVARRQGHYGRSAAPPLIPAPPGAGAVTRGPGPRRS